MTDSLYGDAAAPQGRAKAPSLLEQIEGIFTGPRALFERLRQAPSWLPAMLLAIALGLAIAIVWGLKVDVDAMLRPVLERNPQLSADQIDTAVQMQSRFILPIGILGVLFGIPIFSVVAGLIYWGIGVWQREGEAPSFLHGLAAATVVGLVRLPDGLVTLLVCLFKPVGGHRPDQLTPLSLGYWIHASSPKAAALLNQLNPFNLATFVLLYLAMRHLLKAKPAGAALAVALMVAVASLGVIFAK